MTLSDLTPAYADLLHYADLGRRLTQMAGYTLDQRPCAETVAESLRFAIPSPTPADVLDGAIAVGAAARIVKGKEPQE